MTNLVWGLLIWVGRINSTRAVSTRREVVLAASEWTTPTLRLILQACLNRGLIQCRSRWIAPVLKNLERYVMELERACGLRESKPLTIYKNTLQRMRVKSRHIKATSLAWWMRTARYCKTIIRKCWAGVNNRWELCSKCQNCMGFSRQIWQWLFRRWRPTCAAQCLQWGRKARSWWTC